MLGAACLNVACSEVFLDACLSATLSIVLLTGGATIKTLWAVKYKDTIHQTPTLRPNNGALD